MTVQCEFCDTIADRYTRDYSYKNIYTCEKCDITERTSSWTSKSIPSKGFFTQEEKIKNIIRCEYTSNCSNPANDWVYKKVIPNGVYFIEKKHFICKECSVEISKQQEKIRKEKEQRRLKRQTYKCSICKEKGHDRRKCKINVK